MAAPLPIVLIHGYSTEGKDNDIRGIYGDLPRRLREILPEGDVVEIDLARWISLSDGIALDDVSFALERALRSADHRHLLDSGFHVVIHSTGALVVRNWLRLYGLREAPDGAAPTCPVANLVHLAGANFGSGLAHIGRGTLARWTRQIFKGTDAGIRVLDELEFGSSKTLDLHHHFLQPGRAMLADYGVREFCLIGSQTLAPLRMIPVRYVKEDSSDSTVRTSAGNLNHNLVKVTPDAAAFALPAGKARNIVDLRLNDRAVAPRWYDVDRTGLAATRPEVPFAVVYETAHLGGRIGIVAGQENRNRVMPLLKEALLVANDADYAAVTAHWRRVTHRTQELAGRRKASGTDWNPHRQYEGHAQLVFRLNDQFGDPVAHHDIRFHSRPGKDQTALESMIEDRHDNSRHHGTTTYYLRVQKYGERQGRAGRAVTDLLDRVAQVDFEITGYEPDSGEIEYLPLRMKLTEDEVRALLQPFRTTVVDVTLLRLPTGKVFALETDRK